MNEKQLRIRYIRVLERFLTKTVSLLKSENFDKELFKEKILKNYEDISRVKAVVLYSSYYIQVQNFIDKTMAFLDEPSISFESERLILLKDANLLQKDKKKNTYSKEKHKKQKFDDGY